jgi:hypothetical protein
MKYLDVDGIGQVSRIGVGTWQFGSREWGYGDSYAEGVARDIVQRALALGVTLSTRPRYTRWARVNASSARHSATSVPQLRWLARSSRSRRSRR